MNPETNSCSCGVPSKANYYVFVVHAPKDPMDGDTTYTDAYVCSDHKGTPRNYRPNGHIILKSRITKLR